MMKGLLYKEWMLLRGPWLLLPILVGWPILLLGVVDFQMGMLGCMILSMIPIVLFQEDDRVGWEPFVGAMPVTPAQIVSARYLLTLLLVGGGAVYSLLLGIWHCWGPAGLDLKMLGEGMMVVGTLALLVPIFWFPAFYRWGFVIGAIVNMGILAVVCWACMWIKLMTDIPLYWVLIGSQPPLLALSWYLSIRGYERRRARA